MISIITATYNDVQTLTSCLSSLKAQKTPFEHLVIDGLSKDGALDIIKDYQRSVTSDSSLVTRIISESDHGLYDALNKGIKMAAGDVVGILHADDFYADAEVLTRVAAVFEDPAVEACYGDLLYVEEGSDSLLMTGDLESQSQNKNQLPVTSHQSQFLTKRYWKSGPYDPRKFYWGWMPPHPTFFVRKSVYEKYGLFNLELGTAADYELMLRFLVKHQITCRYIPEVLVKMRVGGVSNATLGNRLRANRNDRRAWEVNGLRPYPWTMILKPLRKVPQWWRRP